MNKFYVICAWHQYNSYLDHRWVITALHLIRISKINFKLIWPSIRIFFTSKKKYDVKLCQKNLLNIFVTNLLKNKCIAGYVAKFPQFLAKNEPINHGLMSYTYPTLLINGLLFLKFLFLFEKKYDKNLHFVAAQRSLYIRAQTTSCQVWQYSPTYDA